MVVLTHGFFSVGVVVKYALIHSLLSTVSKEKFHFQYYLMKEGLKEMFYLTTHSTHFIYGYQA